MSKSITNLALIALLMSTVCHPTTLIAKQSSLPHDQTIHKTATVLKIVNLNTADMKTLMSLKGLGKKKAKAIIAYRKAHGLFKSTNDLAKVSGFSQSLVTKLIKKNIHRIDVKT